MWAFIKLAKVNNRAIGENSPNLVTLVGCGHFLVSWKIIAQVCR
jgi:hypothetical protein